jgi:2-amino-4-hydroxy-6-hydroxymethyldihydropteridine diphosphokinase
MNSRIVYVGLGSNLAAPREQVLRALDELNRMPDTRLARRSALYRSAPLDHVAQPEFVNAVAQLDTALEPARLLAELQAIEVRHGRVRSFPAAPRTLDLDLLLYGDVQFSCQDLSVPHPRMHQRAFVLMPLVELDPAVTVPGQGRADELLRRCVGQEVERIT